MVRTILSYILKPSIHEILFPKELFISWTDILQWLPHQTRVIYGYCCVFQVQYIPRNMHTVFALLYFVVVIHWLIFPYPSGLLHWHCGNLTIAPVPAKQPWWIWINTSCEFIMNDCITTTKQNTTKPCAYFFGYTVEFRRDLLQYRTFVSNSTYTKILRNFVWQGNSFKQKRRQEQIMDMTMSSTPGHNGLTERSFVLRADATQENSCFASGQWLLNDPNIPFGFFFG